MLAKYIKIAASIALLLTIACSSTLHAGADSDKSHHTTQGYKNNYFDGEMVGSLIKWQ